MNAEPQRALSLVRPNGSLPAPSEWAMMMEMGEVFIKSGLMPKHVTNPAAVVAIIQKGRELGIPPMYACSHIHMIEGKLTCAAQVMAALVERDHGPNALRVDETDNEHCTVSWQTVGSSSRRAYTFTIEDAKRAELLGKNNWKHYPAAMLRARALAAAAQMAFPASIAGMYTPDEMGAETDEDGDPINVSFSIREASEMIEFAKRDVPPAPESDTLTKQDAARLRHDILASGADADWINAYLKSKGFKGMGEMTHHDGDVMYRTAMNHRASAVKEDGTGPAPREVDLDGTGPAPREREEPLFSEEELEGFKALP